MTALTERDEIELSIICRVAVDMMNGEHDATSCHRMLETLNREAELAAPSCIFAQK